MKKLLLSASLLLAASTAFAVTDGQSYEAKKGLTITNLWTIDRTHNQADYEALAIASKDARTAATDGKVVYVGLSVEKDGQTTLERFDLETGALMEPLALKLNGEAYVGKLCANQVGFDDYGHLYVAPYNANSKGDGAYKVYLVNTETGELTLAGSNAMEFFGGAGRIDYCDVKGDLTGVEAACTVIAAASDVDAKVYAWTMPQGKTEWEGGFSGMPYQKVTGTYPEGQKIFHYGSVAKHVKDGTGELGMFYVDGFTTYPALYGSDGAIMDHLGNADLMVTDKEGVTTGTVPAPNGVGTNGIAELTCGTQNIIGFSEGQYPAAGNAQVIITAVDGEYSFSSMEHLWTVPADGFATVSDGGTRVHCIQGVQLAPDANGKNATLLVTFKCFNGLAVYRIAEEGYNPQGGVAENVVANAQITVNGDVIAVSEVAEAIEVYNIAGQKVAQANNATEVAAPAAGVYVVKATVAGEQTVAKVVVR